MYKSENDEILNNKELYFECNHIDDLAGYELLKKDIRITPQNAVFDKDSKIRLISNPKSPYGFSSCCLRGDKWEYMGFGHSGAASIVTALLKKLQKHQKIANQLALCDYELEHGIIGLETQGRLSVIELCQQKQRKLDEIKEIVTKRDYLNYDECLDDILEILTS